MIDTSTTSFCRQQEAFDGSSINLPVLMVLPLILFKSLSFRSRTEAAFLHATKARAQARVSFSAH